MAQILCVPYTVLYLEPINERKYELTPLSKKQKENFQKFFKQDLMLYDYFNETLHKKIEAFGTEVRLLLFKVYF